MRKYGSLGQARFLPPFIGTFSQWSTVSIGTIIDAASPGTGANNANRAHYFPLLIPHPYTVARVFWLNAVTVGNGTAEVGVYTDASGVPGSKLVSGSATTAGASGIQFVDVTDTVLNGPARYWLAFVSSTGTDQFYRTAPASPLHACYKFTQNAASPLPSTATPVASASSFNVHFGITNRSTP